MMRVLFSSLMLSFFAITTQAAGSNPWLRTCRIDQGIFWVLQGQEEYSMCFFDQAAVGAEAFFTFKTGSGDSLAIQAYRGQNQSSSTDQVCENAGAELVQGTDTQGQSFNLCKFTDGSLIEVGTLALGPGSAQTQKLDRALSATY